VGARVFVTSRSAEKLRRAAVLGADATVNASPDAIAAEIMRLTEGRGVDVVIENIGGPIWNTALKCPVRGGRIVTYGATIRDQPPADLRRVLYGNCRFLGRPTAIPMNSQHCSDGSRKDVLFLQSARATRSTRFTLLSRILSRVRGSGKSRLKSNRSVWRFDRDDPYRAHLKN
jgi:hypothetical protein